jgi:NAD(P)-dependent dehydrogenase (short-subunit alcohol dehydrogenase family)
MAGRFERRVVLVTGGARGIGEAIIRRAVAEGAVGVVADLGDPAKPLDGVRYVRADVADRGSVESLFASIADREGGVDVLVNNAGIQRVGLTETFDPVDWELVVQTHLMGTFHCSALAIRSMRQRGGGSIIQVASVAGLIALPGRGPYAAAKAAMMSLSRVMAVEVAELGIRVNAVAPGMARTAIVEQGIRDGSIRLDAMLPEIPMRRLATPEDIAGAVLFLASPDAAYITGQTVVVDGGWSILGMHDRPDWLTAVSGVSSAAASAALSAAPDDRP